MSIKYENERVKRGHFRYLRQARGLSIATVDAVEKAIWVYEEFSKDESFAKFSRNRACDFKEWLSARTNRGKPLSEVTIYHYVKHLKGFFRWLSVQPGYKTKIKLEDVEYLSLEKSKVREATSIHSVDFPNLEYVKQLAGSIAINSEIDLRDRALISFLPVSGMRDMAVATLPLGCFDRRNLEVKQFSRKGVRTKLGKSFVSWLFRFDDHLIANVVEWSQFLEEKKLFSSEAPLFPRSKVTQQINSLSFTASEVEPVYWKGTGPIRSILKSRSMEAGLKYYHPHTFRHLAVHLATKECTTAEELKAISQNFGHEHVMTTMANYGRLRDDQVAEIVGSLLLNPSLGRSSKKATLKEIKKLLDGIDE
jgi:integrase/recombinase XerD